MSILGVILASVTVPASAARHGVTITWKGSQGASLGDDIKKTAHRLGKKAHHDFHNGDCSEYGTFSNRKVTFHTARWPKIDTIFTYNSKVRLPYGIRVGQSVGAAQGRLPRRLTWQGPIKEIRRDYSIDIWYAARSRHDLLMVSSSSGSTKVSWAGVFSSKEAIKLYVWEDC
jgi:hypothetical protein